MWRVLILALMTGVAAGWVADSFGPRAAIMLGGALTMMLTGILTTEQAYAAIGWKSVFLVGGMLPTSTTQPAGPGGQEIASSQPILGTELASTPVSLRTPQARCADGNGHAWFVRGLRGARRWR